MPVIDVQGLQIGFRQEGSGPPVVLLHSVLTDSRIWARSVANLSKSYTTIAWDAPGSGQSSDTPEGWAIGDYVRTLKGFLEELGIERPHIVGAAWGTVLAFEFYRAYPDVPRSLVLASAYAGWRGSLPLEEVERRVKRIRDDTELPPDAMVASWIPTLVAPVAPRNVIDEIAAIMREMRPEGVLTMMEAFATVDARDILPQIAVPTLLIYGEGDRRAPVQIGQELHAKIPNSELVVIPGAAHMFYVEKAEAFNEAVCAFLEGVGK
jgi:pimeloyl-ACP methyl ester carboxylesterase